MPTFSQRQKKIQKKKIRYKQLKNIVLDYIWYDHFGGDLSDFISPNTHQKLIKLEQQQHRIRFRSKGWVRIRKHINRIHRLAMNVYCNGSIDDYDHCLNDNEWKEFHEIRMRLYDY